MGIILKAENISKQYRLGLVGTGSFKHDVNRWWHKVRGKEDPYLKVGAVNDRSIKADNDYVWALKDINFEVKEGEVLGIIGKNGAGKSTLLKILSRVTSPTTGSIKTRGRIASLLEVGTGFHPELTGRENIYLNGAILGMTKPEINKKLDEIIDFSGCEMYIDTPVKRYSSGMRVRLGFAVAAHLDPEILVVDEVLAVGDAEFQKKAIGKMQSLSRGEGRTVLFVSHNLVSVEQLCSRCILLENGRLKSEGGTKEIIEEYLEINKYEENFEREKSKRDKKVYFEDIYLVSEKKIKTDKVQCGNQLNLYLDVFSRIKESRVIVEIGLYNSDNVGLVYLSNRLIAKRIFIDEGSNKIRVSVDKVPFIPGDYFVTVRISDADGLLFDRVRNGFRFKVQEGDFYNTGNLEKNIGTSYLLDHNMERIEEIY